MTDEGRPQCYTNYLEPVSITVQSLEQTQRELRTALEKAIDDIGKKQAVTAAIENYGTIFSGQVGMYVVLLSLVSLTLPVSRYILDVLVFVLVHRAPRTTHAVNLLRGRMCVDEML